MEAQAALEELRADLPGAVVPTGSDVLFSAGVDLESRPARPRAAWSDGRRHQPCLRRLVRLSPTGGLCGEWSRHRSRPHLALCADMQRLWRLRPNAPSLSACSARCPDPTAAPERAATRRRRERAASGRGRSLRPVWARPTRAGAMGVTGGRPTAETSKAGLRRCLRRGAAAPASRCCQAFSILRVSRGSTKGSRSSGWPRSIRRPRSSSASNSAPSSTAMFEIQSQTRKVMMPPSAP
jgi:hypothetical protein